jgi:hypothetical protein
VVSRAQLRVDIELRGVRIGGPTPGLGIRSLEDGGGDIDMNWDVLRRVGCDETLDGSLGIIVEWEVPRRLTKL